MRCERLMKDLTNHIVLHLLSVTNVAHFLQESIEFEIPQLNESCRALIIANFKSIYAASAEFIHTLPVSVFIEIIQSDDLDIDREFDLVDIVRQYLAYHAQKGEKIPALPEHRAGPEVWAALTDSERAARTKAYNDELKAYNEAQINKGKMTSPSSIL